MKKNYRAFFVPPQFTMEDLEVVIQSSLKYKRYIFSSGSYKNYIIIKDKKDNQDFAIVKLDDIGWLVYVQGKGKVYKDVIKVLEKWSIETLNETAEFIKGLYSDEGGDE